MNGKLEIFATRQPVSIRGTFAEFSWRFEENIKISK